MEIRLSGTDEVRKLRPKCETGHLLSPWMKALESLARVGGGGGMKIPSCLVESLKNVGA